MIIPILKNRSGVDGLSAADIAAMMTGDLVLDSMHLIPVLPNRSGVAGVPLANAGDLFNGVITLAPNELIPVVSKNSGVGGLSQSDIDLLLLVGYLPLLSNLFAVVGANADFTRTSAATVTDFEGSVIDVLQEESRFWYARRVENLLNILGRNSEDLTVGWAATGPTIVDFETVTIAPSEQLTLTINASPDPFTEVTYSVELTGSTSGNLFLRISDGIDITANAMSVTTTKARFNLRATLGASPTTFNIQIRSGGGGFDGTLTVNNVMVSELAASEPIDEYVSSGVLPAPYHGANVDGVKYFDTDRSGNALTDMRGILSESVADSFLYNSDFITNWNDTNITKLVSSNAAPYGFYTEMTSTVNTSSLRRINRNISSPIGDWTYSAVFKITGNTNDYVVLTVNPFGTNYLNIFQLSTLSFTTLNAPSGGYRLLGTDAVEVFISGTGGDGTSRLCAVGITSSSSATSAAGNIGDLGYVTMGGYTDKPYVSSYIPVPSTAVITRTADDLSVPVTGITDKLSASVEIYNDKTIAGTSQVLYISDGTVNNAISLSLEAGKPRLIVTVGGAVQVDITAASAITLDQINALTVTATANSFELFVNGVSAGTDGAGTFPAGLNTCDIGHENGTNHMEGGLNEWKFYPAIVSV